MMRALDHLFPPTTRIVTWAEPTDDGLVFEAVVDGRVVRADEEHTFLAALYGDNVVPLQRAA